jgi:chromosome segregation protein
MLKSLELFGFKSFADRTRFDFAPGITCVVGPNGSGKSNVVDSIKWILGDQSPKSLRGKEMTDVIFNGSATRKPAGFSEATLTFDNSKRVLAVDANEVQVGRRLYRSGEAEYLINRVPARLKDVKDLFLGTGAGSSAYSIIEQGRVDQLLQTTNINRRAVFEEAAGISRFKVKKVDALRKLERVGQNLLRLTDIVTEVETRLNTLRSQATKAARFRELSHELRELRVGLAADDYRDLTASLQQIETEREALQQQVEQLTAATRELESRQSVVEAELAGVEDHLRQAERAHAENRETIAGHEATLVHQQARQQELEAEAGRVGQQRVDLTARVDQVADELEQTVDSLQRFVENLARRQAELQGKDREIQEVAALVTEERLRLEGHRDRRLDAVRQASILQNRVTGLEAQVAGLAEARDKLLSRRAQFEHALTFCRAECGRRQAAAQAALEHLTSLRVESKTIQDRRGELAARLDALQHLLAELRENRSGALARRTLLEELERRQDGIGIGVREILERAKKSNLPPWRNILGSVADLLDVDLDNAALLEVALGNRSQLIVVDDLQPLLDYVQHETCEIVGRVGFVSVGTATKEDGGLRMEDRTLGSPTIFHPRSSILDPQFSSTHTTIDLSGRPGVVQRADRLVRSASGVHRLAEHLLADTWVVESLDIAFELAAGPGNGCRFVTLQGELLDTGDTLFVGTVRSESALVSRKSELRGIKNDLLRFERHIADGEREQEQTSRALRDLELQWQQVQTDLEFANSHLAELKSDAASLEIELERQTQQLAEIDLELAGGEAGWRSQHQELDHSREEWTRYEAVLDSLREEIETTERSIAQSEQVQQQLQNQFAAEQLDLVKQEERLSHLHDSRSRLDFEREQRDLHREEAERRLQQVVSKRDQIAQQLTATRHALSELTSRGGELADRVAALQTEKDRQRGLRAGIADQELRQRHQLRDNKERLHGLQMKSSELRLQLSSVVERLQEEFQVDVVEAATTGATARNRVVPSSADAQDDEAGASPFSTPPARTADSQEAERSRHAPRDEPSQDSASPGHSAHHAERDGYAASAGGSVPREVIEERINRIRRKLKNLGNVNSESLRELDDLEARFARLSAQLQDLVAAKDSLEEIVRKINTESKRLFIETFDQVRTNFQELFRKLFGGGEADVVLEDLEDVLDCGIDIVARPPGKELRSISLLSGGEKTMTAVALLLAIFKSKPSPFCILDEVDAALDEANVQRYLGVIQEFQQWTQFIVITHSKRTMSGADVLYGITMEEAGVSKRMSVRFDDVSENGEFRASPGVSHAA